MATFAEIVDEAEIRYMIERGVTHRQIAIHFQNIFPNVRGISERSVQRYCKLFGIRRLSQEAVNLMVSNLVSLYGHCYGRKMMQGSLRAQIGVISGAISQRRVSVALRTVAPDAYEARTRDLLERTNPVPYVSPCFGYKCHFDQNEKIGQHYGCTHVAMIDGCSRLVAGFASMPIKNPILIYQFVFRPAILKYGIWDQVRMDHGREFCLVIFVQQVIAYLRADVRRAPFKQTTSTDNNVAERFWPEVNSRINYPIKRAMNAILHSEVMKFLT